MTEFDEVIPHVAFQRQLIYFTEVMKSEPVTLPGSAENAVNEGRQNR